jgi:hypothetical protein
MHLLKTMQDLRVNMFPDVRAYCAELLSVQSQLKAIGSDYAPGDGQMMAFLFYALSGDLDVYGKHLQRENDMTFQKAMDALSKEEAQLKIQAEGANPAARASWMRGGAQGGDKQVCFRCGKPGHIKIRCTATQAEADAYARSQGGSRRDGQQPQGRYPSRGRGGNNRGRGGNNRGRGRGRGAQGRPANSNFGRQQDMTYSCPFCKTNYHKFEDCANFKKFQDNIEAKKKADGFRASQARTGQGQDQDLPPLSDPIRVSMVRSFSSVEARALSKQLSVIVTSASTSASNPSLKALACTSAFAEDSSSSSASASNPHQITPISSPIAHPLHSNISSNLSSVEPLVLRVDASAYAKEEHSVGAAYIDGGAMRHVVKDEFRFVNKKQLRRPIRVEGFLENSESIDVLYEGDTVWDLLLFGVKRQVIIAGCLFCPRAHCNLISDTYLQERGYSSYAVGSTPDIAGTWFCWRKGTIVMEADLKNTQRILRQAESSRTPSTLSAQPLRVSRAATLLEWHSVLGHPSLTTMKAMVKKDVLTGMELLDDKDSEQKIKDCPACQAGKLFRAPFPDQATRRATRTLQRVMMDITQFASMGEKAIYSLGGSLYCLGITDDASRFSDARYLRAQSEAEWLPEVKAYVQFWSLRGKVIEEIRADNAFDTINMNKYAKEHVIKMEFIVPYSPEQNGVQESKFRVAWQRVRIIKEESGMDPRFWALMMSFVLYNVNRTATVANKGVTQFERFYGKKPDVSELHPFGCKVYYKVNVGGHADSNADAGVFVGYDTARKGYLVWSFKANRVFCSRSIHAVHNDFPFRSTTPKSLYYDPLKQKDPVSEQYSEEYKVNNSGYVHEGDVAELHLPLPSSQSSADEKTSLNAEAIHSPAHVSLDSPTASIAQQYPAISSASYGSSSLQACSSALHNSPTQSALPAVFPAPYAQAHSPASAPIIDSSALARAPFSPASSPVPVNRDPTSEFPQESEVEMPVVTPPDIRSGTRTSSRSNKGIPAAHYGEWLTHALNEDGIKREEREDKVYDKREGKKASTQKGVSFADNSQDPVPERGGECSSSEEDEEIIEFVRFADQDEFDEIRVCRAIFDDPCSLRQALLTPEADEWRTAAAEEIRTLQETGTIELTDLPAGKKAIKSKWVLTRKRDKTGAIERYKARLVAKGFSQQPGIDFDETFAPVAQSKVLLLMLALTAHFGFNTRQWDVKSAFLEAPLDHELYLGQPEGYNDGSGAVFRLHKSLYGLKQSAHLWRKLLHSTVESTGLRAIVSDPCVYVLREGQDEVIIISVHVDDITVIASDNELIKTVYEQINAKHTLKDGGPLNWMLGMRVTKDKDDSIFLDQATYAKSVLEQYKAHSLHPLATPMQQGVNLVSRNEGEYEELTKDEKQVLASYPYRGVVGSLLYLSNHTRPDITYALGQLSRFGDKYDTSHIAASRQTLKYIKGSIEKGLRFSN